MNFTSSTYAPDFTKIDGEDPDHAVPRTPLHTDRGTFAAATSMAMAILVANNGAQFVSVQLSLGNIGIHVPMNPSTARIYANAMLKLAADIEQAASVAADAALARAARAPGGAA